MSIVACNRLNMVRERGALLVIERDRGGGRAVLGGPSAAG